MVSSSEDVLVVLVVDGSLQEWEGATGHDEEKNSYTEDVSALTIIASSVPDLRSHVRVGSYIGLELLALEVLRSEAEVNKLKS